MGRVAVVKTYRGRGIGKVLIDVVERHVRERHGRSGVASRGVDSVESIAHAQAYAEGFYQKVWPVFSSLFFYFVRKKKH